MGRVHFVGAAILTCCLVQRCVEEWKRLAIRLLGLSGHKLKNRFGDRVDQNLESVVVKTNLVSFNEPLKDDARFDCGLRYSCVVDNRVSDVPKVAQGRDLQIGSWYFQAVCNRSSIMIFPVLIQH